MVHIIVSKFDHHLPLYRQAELLATQGIDIDRSTLAGWSGQAAALLDPIISRIREQGLKATKLPHGRVALTCASARQPTAWALLSEREISTLDMNPHSTKLLMALPLAVFQLKMCGIGGWDT